MSFKEIPSTIAIIDAVSRLLPPGSKEAQLFEFLKDNPMHPDELKAIIPEYGQFELLTLPTYTGLVMVKAGFSEKIKSGSCQHFLAVVGGSGSGQTSVSEGLIDNFSGIVEQIPTITTRNPQKIRSDEKNTKPVLLSTNPFVMAKRSRHYLHVSEAGFRALTDHKLFIESNFKPWTSEKGKKFYYGTLKPIFSDAFRSDMPNSIAVLDFDGAREVIKYVRVNHPDIQPHSLFIERPITINRLIEIMLRNRPPNEIPAKVIDHLSDVIKAPELDILLLNPEEPNGPVSAVGAFSELLGRFHGNN